MSCNNEQYRQVCGPEIRELHRKLDRLDEAIRGNGKVGILTRLDRLEQLQAQRRRMFWIVAGALVTAGVTLVLQIVQIALKV